MCTAFPILLPVILYILMNVILSFVYKSTDTKLVTLSVRYKVCINVLREAYGC